MEEQSRTKRGRVLSLPAALIAGSVVFSAVMVLNAAFGPERLSSLELMLYQVIIFLLGLTGSYLFGQESAQAAAREIVRPHAVSAFRRVVSLYEALGRFTVSIEERRSQLTRVANKADGSVPIPLVDASLDLLITQVTEQIGTANDAVADWRDIVPDEVERISRELRARREGSRSD